MRRVRLEDRIEQRGGDLGPHQRIRGQSPQRGGAIAGPRRLDRQLFIGLDGLDEPALLRSQRGELDRMRPSPIDDGRDLDDCRIRQVGDRAVVAHVDDLGVAGTVVQRRDELRRGLAVERPAAVIEQLGLLRQVGVAVHLEQPCLDVHDVPGAAVAVLLLVEDRPSQVVVAKVVGRDRVDPTQHVDRQAQLIGEVRRVLVEQVAQPVLAIDADGALPGQVVQAHVLELDSFGFHAEPGRDPPLQRDRHVAQPEGPMAVVDQCLRHDADRVREIDDPGVLRGAA